RRSAQMTSSLSLLREPRNRPAGLPGTFQFQTFILAPSLEIWRKTISGAEGGSGKEVGWPVLGYLLGKNFRRRDRDHLVCCIHPPGAWWPTVAFGRTCADMWSRPPQLRMTRSGPSNATIKSAV